MIIECKPLTLTRLYEVQWFRAKIDLSELARKRWIYNFSYKKIADALGLSPVTIGQHLRRMKKENDLDGLNLTREENSIIKEKWHE